MMRLRPPPLFIVGAAAFLFAGACEGPPFVGTVSRSQFWEYHDQVDEPLCPTLLSLLDEHTRIFAPIVGFAPDPGNPFHYYKFRDENAFEDSYGGGAEGATFDSGVQSSHYFSAHEQAHAYTGRAWGGWSTQLLNEGEATALGCDPIKEPDQNTTPRQLLGSVDWRREVDGFANTDTAYAAAGFFVAHLAQQYGWDQVARLHRSVPAGVSAIDFERAFSRIFPVSMDQAWSDALDAPGAPACDRSWICKATPLAVGDSAQPECDGALHRSLTVDSGMAGVVLDVVDDAGITLSGRCSEAGAPWYPLPGFGNGLPAAHWAFVPPGSYALFAGATMTYAAPNQPGTVTDGEFARRVSLPAEFGLRALIPADTFPATGGCGTSAVVLNPAAKTSVDFFRYASDVWIPIDGGGASYDVLAVNLFAPGADSQPLTICNGCGPDAPCSSIPITSVTIGAGSFLHLQDVSIDRLPMAGQIIFEPAAP